MSEALDTLHWQELKKKMEAAGLPWISKADAIEKLTKLEAPATELEPAVTPDAEPAAKAKQAAKTMLDRNKPYGSISGEIEGSPGARYQQGGKFFTSAGEAIE